MVRSLRTKQITEEQTMEHSDMKHGDIYQKKDGSCYYLIGEYEGSPFTAIIEFKKGINRGQLNVLFTNSIKYDKFIGTRPKSKLYRNHRGSSYLHKMLAHLSMGLAYNF